jgi:hypothetical protein
MVRRFAGSFVVLAVYMFALAVSVFAQQQETRYSILMVGKPAGVQTSNVKPDGIREFAFEYNDRGRGPKITSRIRLDADGLPVSLETVGNDYLKAPVAETFSFENGAARWKNTAEAGEKRRVASATSGAYRSSSKTEAYTSRRRCIKASAFAREGRSRLSGK